MHKESPIDVPDHAGYLSLTLDLYNQYNINEVFAKHEIFPEAEEPVEFDRIYKAFKAEYGVRPFFTCRTVAGYDNYPVLTETWLCMDKLTYKLIDCPAAEEFKNELKCANDQGHFPKAYYLNPTVMNHYYALKDGSIVIFRPPKPETNTTTTAATTTSAPSSEQQGPYKHQNNKPDS